MKDLIKSHPLLAFFILTFFLSWFAGFPAIFLPKWSGLLTLLMSFVPAIAAILIALINGGKQQLITLLHSLTKFRVPWYWYGIVLFFPAMTMIITIFIFGLTNKLSLNASFPLLHLKASHFLFLIGILFYQIVIVWGEELGWRGYALPDLQKKIHPLYASILLGGIWGIWHLPYFFMDGSAQENIPFWFFILSSIGYSILYTMIFNGTKESTWMMTLFHAVNNTTVSFTMMFVPQIIGEPIISLGILFGFNVLIILLIGPKLLFHPLQNGIRV